MTLYQAINQAMYAARNEGLDHIVGAIEGEWAVCHYSDIAVESQMSGSKYRVDSTGPKQRYTERGEITAAMEHPIDGGS